MSETHKQIEEALGSIRQIYLEDTDASLSQLESLRQLNTATTLKYIKKEEELKVLERKTEKVESINTEINEFLAQLNQIETKVDFVDALTEELERFTEKW